MPLNQKSSKAALLREIKALEERLKKENKYHNRADYLADQRAIKIEELEKDLSKTIKNYYRCLGYIDRIKDQERVYSTVYDQTGNAPPKESPREPHGPQLTFNDLPF